MTWAHVIYAVWAAVALAVLLLWVSSARTWKLGRSRIARPSALVRDVLGNRTWLRAIVVLAWVWVGVHFFAR